MINLAALMQVFETEKTEDLKIKIKFVCKRGGLLILNIGVAKKVIC